jgi:hypothetical protein
MRGLYRESKGQTSGNGGTISAPVSAEFPKKQSRAVLWPEVKIIFRSDTWPACRVSIGRRRTFQLAAPQRAGFRPGMLESLTLPSASEYGSEL